MTLIQKTATGFAIVLFVAATLSYIPGVTDADGLAFGIIHLGHFDAVLHLVSAFWALAAALLGPKASRIFLVIFGTLYLGDGVFGIFTGFGFLDMGIVYFHSMGLSFSKVRVLANFPHIVLGAVALLAGMRLGRGR